MTIFREIRTPYEFLIRWNSNGVINGAHVSFIDTVYKDDEILTQTPSPVESVAIAEQEGFPLEEIVSQVLIDALKDNENLRRLVQQLTQENESLNQTLTNTLQEKTISEEFEIKTE